MSFPRYLIQLMGFISLDLIKIMQIHPNQLKLKCQKFVDFQQSIKKVKHLRRIDTV